MVARLESGEQDEGDHRDGVTLTCSEEVRWGDEAITVGAVYMEFYRDTGKEHLCCTTQYQSSK